MVVIPAMIAAHLRLELNGADVTFASPQLTDLVSSRTEGVISRIDGLTVLQKWKMPVAGSAVIRERAWTSVAGQITRLESDGTSSQVANQVVPARCHRPKTVTNQRFGWVVDNDCVF